MIQMLSGIHVAYTKVMFAEKKDLTPIENCTKLYVTPEVR